MPKVDCGKDKQNIKRVLSLVLNVREHLLLLTLRVIVQFVIEEKITATLSQLPLFQEQRTYKNRSLKRVCGASSRTKFAALTELEVNASWKKLGKVKN